MKYFFPLVFQINSPIQLSDQGSEGSYLSLQPPLGRIINDSIQFESMELFFGTSSAFTVPSLLFYAGPVYDSVEDPISAASTSEEVNRNESNHFWCVLFCLFCCRLLIFLSFYIRICIDGSLPPSFIIFRSEFSVMF